LIENKNGSCQSEQMIKATPLDIAVVGMACRFPGAGDVVAFWDQILAARDATSDVPPDRWDPAVFFDPTATANDRVYCQRGGYLEAPIGFDPLAHGIMPKAVDGGEPEQFLVLDAARAALVDAGLPDGVPDGRRVEVVIGRGNYFNRGNLTRLQHGRIVAQTLSILRALHPEWSADQFETIRADLKASLPPFGPATVPSQLTNSTAGRVSNRLDLAGASFVVDAASASSLVALDLGSRALVDRRADLSLVGAVYLAADVDFPMVFCQLGALSRRGQARPFAQDADGTLPGEGVGVVVLKRLADAERDGNRIYAVVKSVGLASDGRGQSLASPSARGHARAMRRAYRQAGIEPATVGLVEGHGLGVPASDRAELRALLAVFPMPDRGRRALGAVSSMIGHAMPAAGMAGLIKTALALHHRVLPPTLHSGSPHALLASDDSPFVLNQRKRPWIHGTAAQPRRAAVNAFGFAGISAHAVLEEHAASADGDTPGCQPFWESEAILLGAPDRAAWLDVARALIEWLGRGPDVSLKDLAYTLNTRQPPFPFRVGIVASSLADLRERLLSVVDRLSDAKCRSIRDARGAYFWSEPLAAPGSLGFLFPGEGSQYAGMLADLCTHFPEVRARFDVADRVAREMGRASLPSEHLFGTAGDEDPELWNLVTAITIVLSSQWALFQLLSRLDLRPDAVLGHSSGEWLALAGAGVLRFDQTFERRLGELGTLFESLEASGDVPRAALVAVAADRDRVAAACRDVQDSVLIAMDNCPHQVVVAGSPEQTATVVARLRAQGILCEELPFARAYHTPEFAPALGPVRAFFADVGMDSPRVPIYSCSIAGTMPNDPEAIRALAVDQWTRPVAFRSTIERMHADGVRLFVEVGARGNLTGFVEDILRGRPHFAVAANLPRRSGLSQLTHLVASLYAQGVSLRTDHLYVRRRPQLVDLAADIRPPIPVPPLAVGFPEMKLSREVSERLRERPIQREITEPNAAPAPIGDSWPHPHAVYSNGDISKPGSDAPPLSRAGFAGFAAEAMPVPPIRSAETDEAMLAYLRTMDEYLETQRQVMSAYLESHSAPSPVTPSAHEQSSETRPLDIEGLAEARVTIRLEPKSEHMDVDSLERILMERVSQRTGYPTEMLGTDLDLEGELGIDSIKRVEILGDLQSLGVLAADLNLDRLTQCRTLRQLIDALEGREGDSKAGEVWPWIGTIETLEPGRLLVAARMLDVNDDPVAEHHTLGGRRVSALDPNRKGLPVVPFTVMAEMLAQAAAVLVPDRALIALRDVQAHKWIRYEDEPIMLELRAHRDPSRPDEVRVAIVNKGSKIARRPAGEGPVVEGVVVFGAAREEGPVAEPFELAEAGPCRFTADELYRDQWLFHGPALRALTWVGRSSLHGIEGTLRVLPRRPILRSSDPPRLLTDAIVLDAFTHLLGCWGLDKLPEGDVIFPLRLVELTFYGLDPPEGAEVACRIAVRELGRHRVRIDAEVVAPGGRVWVRITGWEDWRFYWPGRYRDHLRMPDRVFVGEPLALPGLAQDLNACVRAVWLEPPADMGKPVWRDVLEFLQLGPEERAALRAQGGSESVRTLRLWGRIAAKEAARRLWVDQGHEPVYPADLTIEHNAHGRPRLVSLLEPERVDQPAVSIAHTEGVAVSLAALDPNTRLGIDVERVIDRALGFEAIAFQPDERALLDRLAGSHRAEWVARFWCAKEAAGKATGLGLIAGPPSVTIVSADATTGEVQIVLGPDLAAACPEWAGVPICVSTARRGDYVWAWIVARGIQA
jgi:acyl transferase domain-containing protein/phosphopantetheinyl transferase/acyl carrier protein